MTINNIGNDYFDFEHNSVFFQTLMCKKSNCPGRRDKGLQRTGEW